MTHVKVCGITNVDDAVLANELGATFLGMIFVASSPRHVQLDMARKIVERLRDEISLVGVFQNTDLDEVQYIAEELGLDFVQLHGREDPDYCSDIGRPVIKVIPLKFESAELEKRGKARRFDDVALVAEMQRFPSNVQHFIFDKPKTVDAEGWLENAMARLERVQSECRLPAYFFAGGLNSVNVKSVISRLKPFAVDVASGVEARPGLKDKRLLAEFLSSCKAADERIENPKSTNQK
jgi:phosphoribosylanthranilate isomerase